MPCLAASGLHGSKASCRWRQQNHHRGRAVHASSAPSAGCARRYARAGDMLVEQPSCGRSARRLSTQQRPSPSSAYSDARPAVLVAHAATDLGAVAPGQRVAEAKDRLHAAARPASSGFSMKRLKAPRKFGAERAVDDAVIGRHGDGHHGGDVDLRRSSRRRAPRPRRPQDGRMRRVDDGGESS